MPDFCVRMSARPSSGNGRGPSRPPPSPPNPPRAAERPARIPSDISAAPRVPATSCCPRRPHPAPSRCLPPPSSCSLSPSPQLGPRTCGIWCKSNSRYRTGCCPTAGKQRPKAFRRSAGRSASIGHRQTAPWSPRHQPVHGQCPADAAGSPGCSRSRPCRRTAPDGGSPRP